MTVCKTVPCVVNNGGSNSFPTHHFRRKKMRTDAEILAKIESIENDPRDIFGFVKSDLICCLAFEQAKPFMESVVTFKKDTWEPMARDRDGVLADMKEYMTFAWNKANNCRGLSACRSLMHMQAWLWLLGEDEVAYILTRDYSCYGKPELRAICEHYGWEWEPLDNRSWSDHENGRGDPRPATVLPWKP